MDLDLAQLRALAATVDAGTLEAAARRLHVTTSAVSQRLRALEGATGRVLLVRSRPVTVTPSGEEVLRLARQVELLLADTRTALGDGGSATAADPSAPALPAVPPVLPVAVNADSLTTWVLPALAPLAAAERPVCLDLRREDQARTAHLLRDGTVMGAVTADAAPVAGCSVTPLGAMRYRAVASPGVVARWFAGGVTPEALGRAPVVVFDRDDHLQDHWLATRTDSRTDSRTASQARLDPPRHHVPASADFADAVRLGFGWALLPDLQAAGSLADGSLVLLDDDGVDGVGRVVDVPLFWQQWTLRSPALDAVAAALVGAARQALLQPSAGALRPSARPSPRRSRKDAPGQGAYPGRP